MERVATRATLDYILGLGIAALLPAIFWPLMVKVVGFAIGYSMGWQSLFMMGSAIFLFLAVTFTCVVRNS